MYEIHCVINKNCFLYYHRHNQLTYDKVTTSEIHIKIGGNHSSLFKISYQVANFANLIQRITTVFNIIEA